MKRIIFIKASIYFISTLTHMESGMKPEDFSDMIDFWYDVYPRRSTLYTVNGQVYTEGHLVNIIKYHLRPANC